MTLHNTSFFLVSSVLLVFEISVCFRCARATVTIESSFDHREWKRMKREREGKEKCDGQTGNNIWLLFHLFGCLSYPLDQGRHGHNERSFYFKYESGRVLRIDGCFFFHSSFSFASSYSSFSFSNIKFHFIFRFMFFFSAVQISKKKVIGTIWNSELLFAFIFVSLCLYFFLLLLFVICFFFYLIFFSSFSISSTHCNKAHVSVVSIYIYTVHTMFIMLFLSVFSYSKKFLLKNHPYISNASWNGILFIENML